MGLPKVRQHVRHQEHVPFLSCGRYEPHVFALYQRLVELVQCCGPVTIIPQKTRIVFQVRVRVRFAGCVPRKSYLRCSFWFTRPHDNLRFERYGPRVHGHFVRVRPLDDLDDEFKSWLCEAYAVGEQKHWRN